MMADDTNPDEIARLLDRLNHPAYAISSVGRWLYEAQAVDDMKKAAAALEQQAREIERLNGLIADRQEDKFWKDDEELAGQAIRIRELEAERDQYKDDYFRRHEDVGKHMDRWIKAEADRDAALKQRDIMAICVIEVKAERDALKLHNTAIEAALIADTAELYPGLQDCIATLKAERDAWKKASGSGELSELAAEARARDAAIRAKTVSECLAAAGSWRSRGFASAEAAIRALKPSDGFHCNRCDNAGIGNGWNYCPWCGAPAAISLSQPSEGTS